MTEQQEYAGSAARRPGRTAERHPVRVINQLFTLPSTIERLRQGPLNANLDAYAAALALQGYVRHSIRNQVVVIADLSRWLQHKRVRLQDLDGNVLDRFLQHHQRHNG